MRSLPRAHWSIVYRRNWSSDQMAPEPKKTKASRKKKRRVHGSEISVDEPEELSTQKKSTVRQRKSTAKPGGSAVMEVKQSAAKQNAEIEKAIEKFLENMTELGVEGLRSLFNKELLNCCPPGKATAFEANTSKNRYVDVVCLEDSRVKLTLDVPPATDYIHANWVKFDKYDRKFIATQGPLEETIEDFWRMIFQEQCPTILNLTKCVEDGKAKCAQYWPEGAQGAYKTYGKMFVNIKKVDDENKVTIYTLEVLPEGCSNSLIVKMIHVEGWPDRGVPLSGMMVLRLIRMIATADPLASGPVVIHCSAGVGRTGTMMMIDVLLHRLFKHGQVIDKDVLSETFKCMRGQRASCIQKEGQFVFIVACVMDYLAARFPIPQVKDRCLKFREEFKASDLATN